MTPTKEKIRPVHILIHSAGSSTYCGLHLAAADNYAACIQDAKDKGTICKRCLKSFNS